MSKIAPITVNVDEALALDKYEVDEANAHIEVDLEGDLEEFLKLVRVCPAALYKIDEEGNRSFDYAGCLECGTCRIACGDTIIKKWENPQPTMGVEYRFGGGEDSDTQTSQEGRYGAKANADPLSRLAHSPGTLSARSGPASAGQCRPRFASCASAAAAPSSKRPRFGGGMFVLLSLSLFFSAVPGF